MAPDPIESERISLVGYSDLDGRPPFKIAIRNVDGRWLLYLSHFWYSGWSIVDVTDPADPALASFVEGPANTTTKQVQVADGTMITSLEKPREGYGLVDDPMDPAAGYEEGAYVWDVADDPLDPKLRGHYETGGTGTHRNFYAGGDYAYMCAAFDGFEGSALAVVDVSDPSDPVEVSRWWWPGQSPADERGEEIYNGFHGPAYVDGDRAYLSYGRVGGVTLDVSEPTAPELLARMRPGDGVGSWLGVHSFVPIPGTDLAAINTEAIAEASPLSGGEPANLAAIVDVSEHRSPGFDGPREATGYKVVGRLPVPRPEPELPYDTYYDKPGRFGPHNQHHPRNEATRLGSDELLFFTYFNAGLRIFDVSTPLHPEEVGYYVPENPDERVGDRPRSGLVSHLEDVAVDSRGYVYCTDPNHGLFVLESDLVR